MTTNHEELLVRLDVAGAKWALQYYWNDINDAAAAIRGLQAQLQTLLDVTGDDSIDDAKLSWQSWIKVLNDASEAIKTGEAWDKNHYPSLVDRAYYVALKEQLETERKAREEAELNRAIANTLADKEQHKAEAAEARCKELEADAERHLFAMRRDPVTWVEPAAPLPLPAEIDRLRHDIERHVRICSELATENEALRLALRPLTEPVSAITLADKLRAAELLGIT